MNKPQFSFEFFPTKTDEGITKLYQTFDTLNEMAPSYFSVTYGAGGTTRERTLGIVAALKSRANTPIAPHISCIGDDKSQIAEL
ncbi:MAG TPA: methylenetetrahydrofolate reductase, partial [Psychrobacter pasteurii]|nr:methylenetetrahydrofolate reductase [Psychrobacter pasteurii]